MKERELQSLFDWMRRVPEKVQAVVEEFPPDSIVIPLIPLVCPGRDRTAIVYGYRERERGDVTVLVEDKERDQRGECEVTWLRPVAYGQITPEVVRMVCGREEPDVKRERHRQSNFHEAWLEMLHETEDAIRQRKDDLRHAKHRSERSRLARRLRWLRFRAQVLLQLRRRSKDVARSRRAGVKRLKVVVR